MSEANMLVVENVEELWYIFDVRPGDIRAQASMLVIKNFERLRYLRSQVLYEILKVQIIILVGQQRSNYVVFLIQGIGQMV